MSEAVRYVPLDARGWRLAMGLRPLEESKWLEVDPRRDEELALKSALLAERRDVVVATRALGDEASAELLDELMKNLRTHHPSIPIEVNRDEHPIVAASRLVQEDLCILVRSDQWRLAAASVCFPSRWSLVEKIGTTMDEIHVPVPGYDEELSHPTNALFDRLKPERSFWRLNWTLLDSPLLHQPSAVRSSPSGRLDDWSFRVERQTLRRLVRSGAIVFTIRTYVDSLEVLCRSSEDFAANLLHALDTAPPSMQRYKGWLGVADHLREILTGP
ncbi:MAG: heme-dependent oxidative N-demethylase family protein [Acidimicrobiales bacterium]